MKTIAIVQARMGSNRLPGKSMRSIVGIPMIGVLLSRLSRSSEIDQIVVATSTNAENDVLVEYVENLGFSCFRGSEDDVLSRFLGVTELISSDLIVRITGDCPLVDPRLVDALIREYERLNIDYISNIAPPTFPDGLDIEVFSVAALRKSASITNSKYDHEHVTPHLRLSGQFKTSNYINFKDMSGLRWTVDELEDLEVANNIFSYFSPDLDFTWKDVAKLQQTNPELFSANEQLTRNQGAKMSKGQKLWGRAKRVIPGGNMLLSKRAEMFLPELWPAYFKKSKGCTVWDLDGRAYTDMTIMGVGTNILGYGNEEVDDVVIQAVKDGNMSTLNAPEEVYLAEKLIQIHPWADMVRFARTGGEANAVAIRIARAATAKDKVAVCGYHGWHDWYLSANLGSDDELSGHLLPGLQPKGVPRNLGGTVYPFNYNDFSGLEELINRHDIGIIKMEVVRNVAPDDDFLHKVRELASKRNIVLIFDECTSGFRETLGGFIKNLVWNLISLFLGRHWVTVMQ